MTIMFGWLRRFLTDTGALEARVTGELQAIEERWSRRMRIIEQRLDANEQVLSRLGHQVSRIEGRTSFLKPDGSPIRERPSSADLNGSM